jgi:hypothetical protein
VVLHDAPVHHNIQTGGAGLFGGFFMDDVLLHPDPFRADADGGIDDLRHVLRLAKDVHQIDRERDFFKRRVSLFTRNSSGGWVCFQERIAWLCLAV